MWTKLLSFPQPHDFIVKWFSIWFILSKTAILLTKYKIVAERLPNTFPCSEVSKHKSFSWYSSKRRYHTGSFQKQHFHKRDLRFYPQVYNLLIVSFCDQPSKGPKPINLFRTHLSVMTWTTKYMLTFLPYILLKSSQLIIAIL